MSDCRTSGNKAQSDDSPADACGCDSEPSASANADGAGLALECGCCGGSDTDRAGHTGAPANPFARFINKHGRSISTWGGLSLLLVAFAIHTAEHGFLDALTSGFGKEEHGYPLMCTSFFALSIIASYWFIARKVLTSLRTLRPDMNLLMTVAVIGAVILGDWFEAATVAWLFAVAIMLESWSVGRARRAIEKLMEFAPETARFVNPGDGSIIERPVADVPIGATVVVRPGERIPLDGVVMKGATSVNEAPITGESAPVAKLAGDEVFAGAINNEGAFEFTATKVAWDTTLARIIRMVEETRVRRAPTEQWVEKFARVYTPAVFVAAAALAIVPPLFTGGFAEWFYRALVVLVIACPCALVISTPVSIVAGLAAAARNGVLIKGGVYLELPAKLDIVAFDKTGTITLGRPEVVKVVPLNNHTESELLLRCAALEAQSEHPYARAIVARAAALGIAAPAAESMTAAPGRGAVGIIDGREYFAGSHRMMHERGFETPEYCSHANAFESEGLSVIAVGSESHVCGVIGIADKPREGARGAIGALRDAGIARIVMLTGDHERAARAIAAQCGIDDVRAGLLPDEKLRVVEELAVEGVVAMVGDGVNDAPALTAATVGIAMGAAGTDAAIETADIALMSDDLSKIAWLIRHSRRTMSIVKGNIAFALGVKAVFLILAAFGVATLWMAILADMGASLAVIANGLRLLRPHA